MPERCVKTPLIEAESAGIARAKPSICNDEQRCFGVQGGHRQKTFSLSGQGQAAVLHGARQVVAHRAVRYAQAPGDFCIGQLFQLRQQKRLPHLGGQGAQQGVYLQQGLLGLGLVLGGGGLFLG